MRVGWVDKTGLHDDRLYLYAKLEDPLGRPAHLLLRSHRRDGLTPGLRTYDRERYIGNSPGRSGLLVEHRGEGRRHGPGR